MDQTKLINHALLLLGEEPMADPATPRTKAERAAALHVDAVRQEILQKQRWTSATAFAVVNPEVVMPPAGYSAQGVLPEDFLAIWECTADEFAVAPERRLIWKGTTPTQICYAADRAPAQLDPLLQHAIATRLAHRIAAMIRDSASAIETLGKMAIMAEAEATARDALNRRETPLLAGNWHLPGLSVRRGWMDG
jgi:hypothetical protein